MSIQLHYGDCLEVMKQIPDGSVNMIITSPPYNVNLGNNKFNKNGYNSYNDNLPYNEYLKWIEKCFKDYYRLLANDGRVAINIGDGKNGKITTHADFIIMLKQIGFIPLTCIIWNKHTTSNRLAWGSYMSPSCPSLPMQHEYIIVVGKTEKLIHKGKATISKEQFISWTNPIWEFGTVHKSCHPAAFPLGLPLRIIQLFSYLGDTILDPFMGSGTTGVACLQTDRNFIGIEKDEKYFEVAKNRIDNALKTPTQDTLI